MDIYKDIDDWEKNRLDGSERARRFMALNTFKKK